MCIRDRLWETVTDVDARRRVVASYGFCREHGWRLDRPGGVGGAAIMLNDVIKALIAALDDTTAQSAGGSMWDRLRGRGNPTEAGEAILQPALECPVCAQVRRIEVDAAQALLVYLTPGAHTLVAPFTAGNGLCLVHLRLTLAQPGKAQAHAALIVAQRTIWQRLHGELGEYIRKLDVQFRHEPYGVERDSWAVSYTHLTLPTSDLV